MVPLPGCCCAEPEARNLPTSAGPIISADIAPHSFHFLSLCAAAHMMITTCSRQYTVGGGAASQSGPPIIQAMINKPLLQESKSQPSICACQCPCLKTNTMIGTIFHIYRTEQNTQASNCIHSPLDIPAFLLWSCDHSRSSRKWAIHLKQYAFVKCEREREREKTVTLTSTFLLPN